MFIEHQQYQLNLQAPSKRIRRPISWQLQRVALRHRLSLSHAKIACELAGIAPEVWQ